MRRAPRVGDFARAVAAVTANPPRQSRSEATLRAIVSAAHQVLREKGIDDLTLREVAELAGISQGTLYARFPTKRALVHHLHDDFWATEMTAVDAIGQRMVRDAGPFRPRLACAIGAYIARIRTVRTVSRAFFQAAIQDPALQRKREAYAQREIDVIIGHGVEAVTPLCTPTMLPKVATLIRMIAALTLDAIDHEREYPANARLSDEELRDLLVDIVVRGLQLRDDSAAG